jgi:hypothetical protein
MMDSIADRWQAESYQVHGMRHLLSNLPKSLEDFESGGFAAFATTALLRRRASSGRQAEASGRASE